MSYEKETGVPRLDGIISAIAEVLNKGDSGSSNDLGKRRAEIEKAAEFLILHYGDAALDRAILLEQRTRTLFARSVRISVEGAGSLKTSSR